MTQILSLSVENILGAESIKFAPNGQSVTIGGANGEGKSSAIWALVMALGGKGQIPEKPVHDGEEVGIVKIELDKFNVHLEVTPDRKQKLVVSSADGARYQGPQDLLNKLFGGLSFDPGGFMAMAPEKRFETLRNLVKLDLSDLKTEYETLYVERRDVGRDVKTLEGKIAGEVVHDDVPEAEIDIVELVKQRDDLTLKIAADDKTLDLSLQEKKFASMRSAEVAGYEQAIKHKEEEIASLRAKISEARLSHDAHIAKGLELHNSVNLATYGENKSKSEELKASALDAGAINAKVQQNLRVKSLQQELGKLNIEQGERDKKLEDLVVKKQKRLSETKFPIDGLSIDADVVTFNKIPFDQLSESEQWEVSTAIGFALNPKGIVFMKNCGGLDRKSRDRVRARAAASGVQLFLEVVDDADDVQIVINDGKVLENRLEK